MMYEMIMEAQKRKAILEKNKKLTITMRSLYFNSLANTNLILRDILKTMYSNKYENCPTILKVYRPQDLNSFMNEVDYNIDEQIACAYHNRNNIGNEIMYVKVLFKNKTTFLPIVYNELINALDRNNVDIIQDGNSFNFNFRNNREMNIKNLRA